MTPGPPGTVSPMSDTEPALDYITPGLRGLGVPIDWIKALPGNPRRGKTQAIARSFKRFGQRKPLVVWQTGEEDGHPIGYAEAGNHGLLAARDILHWSHVAVVWVNEDEKTAKAFSLADNQTHDLGDMDSVALRSFVAELTAEDDTLLADAGFDDDALKRILTEGAADLVERIQRESGDENDEDEDDGEASPIDGTPRGLGTPVISTSIVFDDEGQQRAWYRLVRHLRESYPDAETTGERIQRYVIDTLPAED